MISQERVILLMLISLKLEWEAELLRYDENNKRVCRKIRTK